MARAAAITIDVDSLGNYHQIHGLDVRDEPTDPIYDVAMARFWELVHEAGVPATLFLIGKDAPAHAEAFRPAMETGSEIASHSFEHDYRLTGRTAEEIRADLVAADEALSSLSPTGEIRGFRAPGYNTSPALLEAVIELGYAYDSSLLPAPLYYATRAAAIAWYAARGRPSRSLVGRARAFAGPLDPYRINASHPWRKAEAGQLWEFPIACEPFSRSPIIGTSWVLLPRRARRIALRSALARLSVMCFEMHAIDLLDRTDPGISSQLAEAQADLRVPVREKMAALGELFHVLANETSVRCLADLAAGAPRFD